MADWSALPVHSMHIRADSTVDLSALRRTAVPAGSRGRVFASGEKLYETRAPTVPVRFHVCQWALNGGDVLMPTDTALITAGVEALARQGYNAVRLHGPEYYLMAGTTGAFTFVAERLAALDWALAEFKRCGIYWIANPKQEHLYQDGQGSNRYTMPPGSPDLKAQLFTQTETRTHWRTGFEAIWNRTNPHTGINYLADPAMVLIEPMNENSALFCVNRRAAVWPAEWATRDVGTTQGTAGKLFHEWLADNTQAHGYANLAALNSAWGTSHASFAAAGNRTANLKNPTTEADRAAILYTAYLDDNMWDYYDATLTSLGYTGLRAPIIVFPQGHAVRLLARKGNANTVHDSHTYVQTFDGPVADGAALLPETFEVTGGWNYNYAISLPSSFSGGARPRWCGEYGWMAFSRYRSQYAMAHAYAAMHGASAHTQFHQGNFFESTYSSSSPGRIQIIYPGHDNADYTLKFAQVAGFFALHRGYVVEASPAQTFEINDNDLGLNPTSLGRIARYSQDFLTPFSRVAAACKMSISWKVDNSGSSLTPTWYPKSLLDWYTDLIAAGAMTADNEGYLHTLANSGNILGVDLTDPEQPIIHVASHTLFDGAKISVLTLNGSGANWPGTAQRNGTCTVDVVDSTHLRITGSTIALNAATWTGVFTSGTWCDLANHQQSGDKQLRMSRRDRFVSIDTAKMKFLGVTEDPVLPAFTGMVVESIEDGGTLLIASLDDQPLATSSAMLVGLCGHTQNTGEVLSADLRTMVKAGTYPIQLSQVSASMQLTVTRPAEFWLRPLALDGAPGAYASATAVDAGTVRVDIATGTDPIQYWELSRRRLKAASAL